MSTQREKLIELYCSISGEADYQKIHSVYLKVKAMNFNSDMLGVMQQALVLQKLKFGLQLAKMYGEIYVVVEIEELEDLERKYKTGMNGINQLPAKKTSTRKTSFTKKAKPQIGKYTDQGKATGKGMQDIYWENNGMKLLFNPKDTKNRKGVALPSGFRVDNERYLMQLFNLDAIEYGHWLNQQDRANYLGGVALSMLDLAAALGMDNKQIGFGGKLSIGLGARGRGKARAHFSPTQFFINLTRFARPSKFSTAKNPNPERNNLFFLAGGANAFAHEFGHALDYFLGANVLKLKGGYVSEKKTSTKYDAALIKQKTIQGYMHKILSQLVWNKDGNAYTEYFAKIHKHKMADYLCLRTEMFARLFEQYIHFKLTAKKWYNYFLCAKEYTNFIYLPPALFKQVLPDIEALINLARKAVPR